ncbi:uncharacterized protein EDB91DRAFT_1086579 [Suillus paluster]|uniref:uncharacterized protein n=1 Tax=Suillus paluster TaxID=48578 RepID=UPI001B874E0B|nr:uncharacterized protein EDB91DRAFT_1086579 [Suillus paluster]KAG1726959.1 hypothetical protein EDB91DRAFT_1086579 [Suillus paluster]
MAVRLQQEYFQVPVVMRLPRRYHTGMISAHRFYVYLHTFQNVFPSHSVMISAVGTSLLSNRLIVHNGMTAINVLYWLFSYTAALTQGCVFKSIEVTSLAELILVAEATKPAFARIARRRGWLETTYSCRAVIELGLQDLRSLATFVLSTLSYHPKLARFARLLAAAFTGSLRSKLIGIGSVRWILIWADDDIDFLNVGWSQHLV